MGYILGISAYYHDSAAALIKNGEVISASQEERYTRVKHDSNFPHNSIKYLLNSNMLTLSDIDAVVFYDKPFLKFERLLETYSYFSPRGFKSFKKAIPIWLKDKLFLKRTLKKELNKFNGKLPEIFFSEHHLSHLASCFYPSPFEDTAILTIDGVGEWATTTLARGSGNNIEILKEVHFPHSIGLLYSAFTYYLGFKVNSGEYKLMGLAPYGNPESKQVVDFKKKIKSKLINIKEDGSYFLNMDFFNYATGFTMCNDEKWEKLFGFPRKKEEDQFNTDHLNLALACQQITQEIVLLIAKHLKKITGSNNICLAGGVALNCVANQALIDSKIFENIWIQPASGDAGGALGAAFAYYYLAQEKSRRVLASDSMKGAYLGDSYNQDLIRNVLFKHEFTFHQYNNEKLFREIATQISNEKVIGWFQGKMEYGPRALGNRSILADPRSEKTQKQLNLKIKFREGFRPFAPSVIEEDAKKFFDGDIFSPYMLITNPVSTNIRETLPTDYNKWDITNKLYFKRSKLPAITHIDFSARVQVVKKETNAKYYSLIKKFKEITGYGVVVNTSFNVRGEPIVRTPEDAINCFMNTNMDILVLENFVIYKDELPEAIKSEFNSVEFKKD